MMPLAPPREITMKIKIVKKGSFTPKPLMSCPLLVDEDGLQERKK
jgi:hypothetical protein